MSQDLQRRHVATVQAELADPAYRIEVVVTAAVKV